MAPARMEMHVHTPMCAEGSTLNGAVLHFGNRKNDHIHHVGLSRIKNLTNLFILELNEKKIEHLFRCQG